MAADRPVTIVIGDAPATRRRPGERLELEAAGLTFTVAVVMDTHREDDTAMFLDHALWIASARAVNDCFTPDASAVEIDAEPTFLDRRLGRIPSRPFGSFESYADHVTQVSDPVLWQLVRWRKLGRLVAMAAHEQWWRLGGPYLYHDSYTARYFVARDRAPELVERIRARLAEAGGRLEEVVDFRAQPDGVEAAHAAPRAFGSSRSRRPSPSRLNPSTVR